jgi:hypothetical protein
MGQEISAVSRGWFRPETGSEGYSVAEAGVRGGQMLRFLWALSLAFPGRDIPVPKRLLPVGSFERAVINSMRKVHGARVRTTIKAGEIVFHGIALKLATENRKAETKVVPFESKRKCASA